jgi:hypothetical protein
VTASRRLLLAVAGAACLAAPALLLAGVQSPLRAAAVLGLMCLAPGAALLPLLRARRAAPELGLVIATSLAVSTLVAQAMLWLDAFSPDGATCALAAASLAGIAAQLARWRAPAGP